MRNRFAYPIVALVVMLTAAATPELEEEATTGSAVEPRASLTVYSDNLALVRRDVDRALRAGTHTVRIDGLPTNLDPASLTVLNPEVTLLGVHGLRSYQDAARGSGASLDLDLSVRRGVETLRLAFLTNGLNWSADYTMVVARNDASARIDGYATLVNGSGVSYDAAEVQLMAGTIQRGRGVRYAADELRRAVAFEAAQAPGLEEAAFGDYHLYTVSTPLDLRAGESRRIRMVGAESVKTRKEYTFASQLEYHRPVPEPNKQPVAVSYRILRPEKSEFGSAPLPAGQIRLLQEDTAGRAQLLGIASIGNTPKGEDLRLGTGYAFDIVGTRTQTDYQRPGGNIYESAWRVELRNAGDAAVTVQVIEQVSGDWQIVESTHRAEKLSAGAVRFEVEVAAGGRAELAYRVRVRS